MKKSRSSLWEAVRTENASAVGDDIGTVTVGPGFGRAPSGTGLCNAKNAGDTVRNKYSSRLHPRLLCTDEEQELRYPFSSFKN